MWHKAYRDYRYDRPLIQYQVSSSHGIIGCEMHDLNGWGDTWHGQLEPLIKEKKEKERKSC